VSVIRNAEFFAAKIPRAQLTIFPAPTGHMVFTGRCLEAGRTRPASRVQRSAGTAPSSRRRPPAWRRRCLRHRAVNPIIL
jgi:hypothetical protein